MDYTYKLLMSDDEIRRSYNESGKKVAQITILSELNACSIGRIKEILGITEKPKRVWNKTKAEQKADWQKIREKKRSLYEQGYISKWKRFPKLRKLRKISGRKESEMKDKEIIQNIAYLRKNINDMKYARWSSAAIEIANEMALRLWVPVSTLPKEGLRVLVSCKAKNGNKTERAIKYKADFMYTDKSGKVIVEDVKGMRTTDYKLKRKMFLFKFGEKLTFQEIQ